MLFVKLKQIDNYYVFFKASIECIPIVKIIMNPPSMVSLLGFLK